MPSVEHGEQKAYWQGMAKRRSPDHPAVVAFAEPKLRLILDALGDVVPGETTMLEVGAGNGFFSHTFAKTFRLTCLDFSENMLAMHPLPWEQKVVGDAQDLRFEAGSFDVVFCGNLLHHLPSPEAAVREMARVARRHVVLLEPNAVNPLMFAFGLIKRQERGTLKFTPGYLKGLGRAAGLRLRRFATQGAVVPNKTPPAALPVLQRLDGAWPLGFYHLAVFDVA